MSELSAELKSTYMKTAQAPKGSQDRLVDRNPFGGYELGVSRSHVRIDAAIMATWKSWTWVVPMAHF